MEHLSEAWIACIVLFIAFASIFTLAVMIYCRYRRKPRSTKNWSHSIFVVDKPMTESRETISLKHIKGKFVRETGMTDGNDNQAFSSSSDSLALTNDVDYMNQNRIVPRDKVAIALEQRESNQLNNGNSDVQSEQVESVERLSREMAEKIAEHQFRQKSVMLSVTNEKDSDDSTGSNGDQQSTSLQLVAKQRTAV